MLTNRIFTFFLLLLLFSQSAFALNLQSYRFSDSYRYAVLDDALNEKFEGKYIFTASIAHMNSPFYYSDRNLHNLKREIIDYNNILTAGFSYYLNKNVSLGLDLNAINNETSGKTYTTMADSVVKSRISLMRGETYSFSLNPQVFIPTGNGDNFSTMGSVSGGLSAVYEKSFDRLHLLASLGGFSSKNNRLDEVDHRQLLLSQLGVSYDLNDKWNVNAESYRNFPLVDDRYQDMGQYLLTAKHKTHKNFSTYFGGGASGLEPVQRNTYVAFLGFKFHEAVAAAPVVAAISTAQAAPMREPEEVYFQHNSSAVDEAQEEKLNSLVERFNKMKSNVTIEGYASAPGSVPYNQALSERRALAVKKFLTEQGVSESMLSTKGYGEEFAQDPDESKNRKVKFKFE
jgi:outer membrane protein OmpA-like peptidoglycan-associated protein